MVISWAGQGRIETPRAKLAYLVHSPSATMAAGTVATAAALVQRTVDVAPHEGLAARESSSRRACRCQVERLCSWLGRAEQEQHCGASDATQAFRSREPSCCCCAPLSTTSSDGDKHGQPRQG